MPEAKSTAVRGARAALSAIILLAPVGGSAQSLVQWNDSEHDGGYITTFSVTYAGPVDAGDSLIAICRTGNSQASIALSDTINGPWTQALLANDQGNRSIAIAFYASSKDGATTVSCTWGTSTADDQLTILEYTGLDPSRLIDQTSTSCPTPVTPTPNSGAVMSSGPSDLLIGAITIAA